MSILTWIEDKKRLKVLNAPKYVSSSADSSKGLWTRCDKCGVILYIKHLKENQRVCFGCSYHLQMMSQERIENLLDKVPAISSPSSVSKKPEGGYAFATKKPTLTPLSANYPTSSAKGLQAKIASTSSYPFGISKNLVTRSSTQMNLRGKSMVSTWRPLDETVSPCDPLRFHDQKTYTDRLKDAQERTGLQDAIQTGTGMIDGIPVALAVMDFSFMGGSMGSVVGEKITRLIEYATQEGLTLLIVSASGGARMQEGVFSLMQMAKISSSLQIYQSCAKLLYISILTSPTTGGVTASFAMLGDIIFAEPKALIAFAGRRVIEQTLAEDLPEDFQTSESMLHHGLVDLIVPRRFLRQALSETIRLYQNAPFKKIGIIPFGVQNPITFLTEEKVRRQWGTLTKPGTKEMSKNESKSSSINFDLQKMQEALSVPCRASTRQRSVNTLGRETPYPSIPFCPFGIRQGQGKARSQDMGIDGFVAKNPPEYGLEEQASSPPSVYRDILTSFEMMLNLFAYGKTRNESISSSVLDDGNLTENEGVDLLRIRNRKSNIFALLARAPYLFRRGTAIGGSLVAKPPAFSGKFAQTFLQSVALYASRGKKVYWVTGTCPCPCRCARARVSHQANLRAVRTKVRFVRMVLPKQNLPSWELGKKEQIRGERQPTVVSPRANVISFGRQRSKKNLPLDFILKNNSAYSDHNKTVTEPLGLRNTDFSQNGDRQKFEMNNGTSHLATTQEIMFRLAKNESRKGWPSNQDPEKNRVVFKNVQKGKYQKLAKALYQNNLQQILVSKYRTTRTYDSVFARTCLAGASRERAGYFATKESPYYPVGNTSKQGKFQDFQNKNGVMSLSLPYTTPKEVNFVSAKPYGTKRYTKAGGVVTKDKKDMSSTLLPAWPHNKTDRFLLLHNFRSFSENVVSKNFEESRRGLKFNSLSGHLSLSCSYGVKGGAKRVLGRFADKNDNAAPNVTKFASQNADINFLNQAIELAATDSVEWRCFYIHQQLAENIGFLEDFLQQDHDSRKKNGNLLFYKSICRSKKMVNEQSY